MKLIVGLGNPGEKYKLNRHNVGFMFVEYLCKWVDDREWKMEKKFEAEMCEIEIKSEKALLVKPQTFMNDSGKAVQKISKNNNLMPNDLIVIHDDLDIKLGEYKIQIGKGPKLHNGIESIENHMHTKEFTRVRIGVDNRSVENRIPGEAYVLQNFTPEEIIILNGVFSEIVIQI